MLLQKSLRLFRKSPVRFFQVAFSEVYNSLFARPDTRPPQTESAYLNDVIRRSQQPRTDISDHLITLFNEAVTAKPKLIVELGVRGGESTFVLERVARLTGAHLVSVDIEDCSDSSSYENWNFIQMDDVAFAKQFKSWCAERNIDSAIDVLFIDTSHLFDHTVEEINNWLPLTSSRARVILHDTNMGGFYFRTDGSMGVGPDNQRGVIAALERYFRTTFREKRNFIDYRDGWLIRHYARSSGFTILERNDTLRQ